MKEKQKLPMGSSFSSWVVYSLARHTYHLRTTPHQARAPLVSVQVAAQAQAAAPEGQDRIVASSYALQ